MKYSLNCQTLPSECATSITMAKKLEKSGIKATYYQAMNADWCETRNEARLHVSTLAHKHVGMVTCQHALRA